MMVSIKGQVKYPVYIDPGTLIFDERRVDMATIFDEKAESPSDKEYRQLGAAFDSQRKEGAMPQSNQNIVSVSRRDLKEKSYGISIAPFIQNASPLEEATMVKLLLTEQQEESLPLDVVNNGFIKFSEKGSPLKDDGPFHFYFGDGSNKDAPIVNVTGFEIV
ncbi:peptidyl-prolyl cis-trans isomerase [Paenalkalicoccus suaedae]|uniref:Peptidyl-prolyl cis-trans isomerase n=1 Tax=Paenalkalicoccus suaedae TaxID=2592382 RepID=A0A859FEF6_9BACI|nr:peptidyl-prolyl cis-trans isomerase [Paenalkalicoccus suaedae]QKS71559.1 peptidyl-prolyl cis-trans isomerase [Paenalkalicoccus suaedae]